MANNCSDGSRNNGNRRDNNRNDGTRNDGNRHHGNSRRKGSNRNNNNEDFRRPSAPATVFDVIKTKYPGATPATPTKEDYVNAEGYQNNSNSDNAENYDEQKHQNQPRSSSNNATEETSQMKTSDDTRKSQTDGSHNNRGHRRNYRGKPFRNNYGHGYAQSFSYFVPDHTMLVPQPGFIPPLPHHPSGQPSDGIVAGCQVVAPFADGNYYQGIVLVADDNAKSAIIHLSHQNVIYTVPYGFLQKCNVNV